MKRLVLSALATVMAVTALSAQTPAGWKMRVDKSTSASDPDGSGAIKFVTMGTGMHATNPQAATYFNPANTATGNYVLKGSFTLVKPSSHANYYGLVFGGAEMDGANQNYLYFVVAQDGTFLIKHRAGEATHDVQAKTPHAAVAKPDASGKSVNNLEVRVQASKIDYLINGQTVHSTPKSGMTVKTDGLYGARVNHQLEVHIDGLSKS